MTMPADMHRPVDVADAVAFLDARAGRAVPVAGGTDLVIDRRLGRVDPEWLVDLSGLAELRGVTWSGDHATIGALTSIRTLELDAQLALRASAVVDAARVLGSVQIRTMATLGGNLAHATPSAEMAPPLLAHDATVHATGPGGTRAFALDELFAGPGETTLTNAELLTRIELRAAGDGEAAMGSCYLRQTVRWAMDLAGVGAAAMVRVVDDAIVEARIALGAVAPVPVLVPDAAALLVGAPFDLAAARRAGALAAEASRPISDARGPGEYRREVVAVLVARAIHAAWLRATGRHTGPVPQHGLLPQHADGVKGDAP